MKRKLTAIFVLSLAILPAAGLYAQADAASVQELYNEGYNEYRNENYYRAIELYKMALQLSPSYLDPLRGLAESYFMLGEYREALNWCIEALRYDKNNLVLKTLQARILIGLQAYEQAEQLFREVLEVEPYNFEAQFGMAELDIVRGRTLQAQLWYEKAMELRPENRRAILSLALVYEAAEELEKAEELVKLALHHYPSGYMVQFLAGKLYLKKGELQKAEMHIKKALALKKYFPDATLLLSTIYLQQEQYAQVVETIEKLLQEHRNNHLLWYTLGVAYERNNHTAKSLQAYARTLRIRPDDEIARIAIENLVMTEYSPDAPERERYAEYHFQKGKTLQKRNYFQQALEEYRRGLLLAPFSKEGRELYAEIFKAFGYYDKYLSELKILQDEGLADNRIRDEIEIYSSLLDDEISDKWKIRQYPDPLQNGTESDEMHLLDQSGNKFSFLLFYDPDATETGHPLSTEDITDYFYSELQYEKKIQLFNGIEKHTGFSTSFQKSRQRQSDFFIIFTYRENGRAFSAECELYNGATGSKIRSFRVFRTGNDKVKRAITRLSEYINAALPFRGRLMDKEFDTAVINLGRYDGIEPEMQFNIIETGKVELNPENLEFSYPDDSVLGTFTVTATDELISEGTLESALFFDLINPGDTVVPVEETEESEDEAGPEEEQAQEQEEEAASEEAERSANLDLYREILKIQ